MDDDLLIDLIPSRVDALVAALDRRIGAQLDEILHHPTFQRLERVWRGLWFVVERTRFDENIQLEMVDCSKEDLRADLCRAPTPRESGLAAIAYHRAIGAGIEPYGAIVTTFEFGPEPDDAATLRGCAEVAHLAVAPFIAAASPRFFGVVGYSMLAHLASHRAALQQNTSEAFADLRRDEASRALGLVLPRFLLRSSFSCEAGEDASFEYKESSALEEDLCWGSAAFAFASRLVDSFARYRWCPNIIGSCGVVEGLSQRDELDAPSTEVRLNEVAEAAISEHGLIPLLAEAPGEAWIFSASSVHQPERFPATEEGQARELNGRLDAQLPYFFIAARIVHYLRVVYRSYRHSFESQREAERELNDWVGQFVADRHVVATAIRGRRPLRKALVTVFDSKDEEGWQLLEMKVRPHFKYMGAFFTLTISGQRLEKT